MLLYWNIWKTKERHPVHCSAVRGKFHLELSLWRSFRVVLQERFTQPISQLDCVIGIFALSCSRWEVGNSWWGDERSARKGACGWSCSLATVLQNIIGSPQSLKLYAVSKTALSVPRWKQHFPSLSLVSHLWSPASMRLRLRQEESQGTENMH
jgi:hypothetical protein